MSFEVKDQHMINRILRLPERGLRFARRKLKKDPNAFLRQVRGVVHVGANIGQERELYAKYKLDVVWIEPISSVFSELKANLKEFPRQHAYQYLVTDRDGEEYTFHVANNQGASSSILEFDQHKDIWPDVNYTESIRLESITLTSLFRKEGIETGKYDALVMDTQGSELLVLKGAESMIRGFKYVQTEAADFESYAGGCRVADIEEFLKRYGFSEIWRTKFASNQDGGSYYDIVYRRSS
jgi:FkbM family methyltransferase